MLKAGLFALMCGCVVLREAPASGEEPLKVDCENPVVQIELNYCAEKEYESADKALNAQWKATRQVLAGRDRELEEKLRGGEQALLNGQRAWIGYRDGQCEAEAFSARGGTAEPMLLMSCKAELTRQRTEELKQMVEGF